LDFGIGTDADECGFGLNPDVHAKKGRELTRGFGDGDDGGAIIDADDAAGFAVKTDDIAGAKSVWGGVHDFERVWGAV
jgi:hypothetical protein